MKENQERRTSCLICNAPIEQISDRREKLYCSSKCRHKAFSAKPKEKPKFKTIPIEQWEEIQKKLAENNKPENKEKILKERNTPNKAASKATNPLTIDEAIPPMPTRNEGEDAFDFAARKNEWKKLYNQK